MFHRGGDGKPRGLGFSGFVIGSKKSDPPPTGPPVGPPKGKQSGTAGLGMMESSSRSGFMPGRSLGYHTNLGKRRVRSEEQ